MSEPALRLRADRLCKRYGDQVALHGFSLCAYQGEILALIGENGAGKSTAMNLMAGLIAPDEGTLRTFGRVGACPQQTAIWSELTCIEQLRFCGELHNLPSSTARARANSLLHQLGLADSGNRLGRTLSGGNQRRLSLALGLINQPEILFLDEPEVGLDLAGQWTFYQLLIQLRAAGTTIILSTHNLDEAERVADRIAILHAGRLSKLAPLPQLLQESGGLDLSDAYRRLASASG